jgi:hypothetical protein
MEAIFQFYRYSTTKVQSTYTQAEGNTMHKHLKRRSVNCCYTINALQVKKSSRGRVSAGGGGGGGGGGGDKEPSSKMGSGDMTPTLAAALEARVHIRHILQIILRFLLNDNKFYSYRDH